MDDQKDAPTVVICGSGVGVSGASDGILRALREAALQSPNGIVILQPSDISLEEAHPIEPISLAHLVHTSPAVYPFKRRKPLPKELEWDLELGERKIALNNERLKRKALFRLKQRG